MDNIIVKLIDEKMKADNWTAETPDSYYSYLMNLTNEEIFTFVVETLK